MTTSISSVSVFEVRNIDQAKSIILTPEDSTTEARWRVETPYLGTLIGSHLDIQSHHRVLDYGCGVGRMSKQLIGQYGCSVFGADTSVSMRALAAAYVNSDKFLSCAPSMLPPMIPFTYAISVWTLQHIPDLNWAIRDISLALRSYGRLFVVNNVNRALPAPGGMWFDDELDTRELLCARFEEVAYGALDPEHTTPNTARGSFWGVYERRN